MKYKSIFKLCLLTTFLSVATISCDDWTEMEIHDSQVNGNETEDGFCRTTFSINVYSNPPRAASIHFMVGGSWQ